MSHIPQNIVVTNHLFCDSRIVSGLSPLKHTFPLHPLRMYISFPPSCTSIFLGFFCFSCSSLALLTFPILCTRSNTEIMFLWYAVARVCQERGGCWMVCAMDSGRCGVVPLPFRKALSVCPLVFTHLRWRFPSGRADICQKARTSALMPWPAAALTSSAALEEIRRYTR